MLRNNKGVAEVALLAYVIGGLILLFVPNPVSTAVGLGVRPNKIIESDKITLINDKDGVPVAYRQVVTQKDVRDNVTFWEWLRSLPGFVLFLMVLGAVFPPAAIVFWRVYGALMKSTKQIVVGVDKALDKVQDPAVKETIYTQMGVVQDMPTKKLVDKIQGK
jgi:hypothetical protein